MKILYLIENAFILLCCCSKDPVKKITGSLHSLALMVIILSSFAVPLWGENEGELRGAWIAWAGTNVPTKEKIAETMDSLAAANFNIVYVDVWRYGYPYFRSDVFYELTGYYTDPSLTTSQQPERDILAEMIAEARRNNLAVDAWFEAGFNGGANMNSPLIQAKPRWLAKKKNGDVAWYSQAGPSMIHVHPEVQQFLIDLSQEVALKYDIDGIEFDRVRYPGLDCGYDVETVALYKSEHDGASPPTAEGDGEWVQWRADKLTEFMRIYHDSLKAVRPDIKLSNAPLPWGPEQFCQDWSPWINNGYIDHVTPQMYYTSLGDFTWRLDRELGFVENDALVYPGISTVANGNYTQPSVLAQQIEHIREKGLHGHVIWYHANLVWHSNNYLSYLRNTVYAEPAAIPYFEEGWRIPSIVVDDTSSLVEFSGAWTRYTGAIPLYNGACYYAAVGSEASVSYSLDIPQTDVYALYTFVNTQALASQNVHYTVHSRDGDFVHFLNQRRAGNAGRWQLLGEYYFEEGRREVLTLSAQQSDQGNNVFTDAVLLVKSNRPDAGIITNIPQNGCLPSSAFLIKTYPNPFNHQLTIQFDLQKASALQFLLYSLNGELTAALPAEKYSQGVHQKVWDFSENATASGVYLLVVKGEKFTEMQKITLLK
jgi:uncharacterized lipoprotein YddW (UPF0748 family)